MSLALRSVLCTVGREQAFPSQCSCSEGDGLGSPDLADEMVSDESMPPLECPKRASVPGLPLPLASEVPRDFTESERARGAHRSTE